MSAPEISADTVKQALARLRQGTLEEICAALDMAAADWRGRDRVRKILRDLQRSAQVRAMPGAPLYLVQEKLWRAILLKFHKAEAWGFLDLATLAGCSLDYAKKYCEFLERRELIAAAGVQGHQNYFRLTPGREHEGAPAWNRRAEKRRAVASSQ